MPPKLTPTVPPTSGGVEQAKAVDAANSVNIDFINQCSMAYKEVTMAYPLALGKAASKKEREEKKLMKDVNFVYSELTFETIGMAVEKIKNYYGKPGIGHSGIEGVLQGRGGTFYDLGAGKWC